MTRHAVNLASDSSEPITGPGSANCFEGAGANTAIIITRQLGPKHVSSWYSYVSAAVTGSPAWQWYPVQTLVFMVSINTCCLSLAQYSLLFSYGSICSFSDEAVSKSHCTV
jgi:hypothetical protein